MLGFWKHAFFSVMSTFLHCLPRKNWNFGVNLLICRNMKKSRLFLITHQNLFTRWSWVFIMSSSNAIITRKKTLARRLAEKKIPQLIWGSIFSHVRPSYEWAVSDKDRSMHISLWVQVAHSSFIEGSHTTKNAASACNSEFEEFICLMLD